MSLGFFFSFFFLVQCSFQNGELFCQELRKAWIWRRISHKGAERGCFPRPWARQSFGVADFHCPVRTGAEPGSYEENSSTPKIFKIQIVRGWGWGRRARCKHCLSSCGWGSNFFPCIQQKLDLNGKNINTMFHYELISAPSESRRLMYYQFVLAQAPYHNDCSG